MVPQPNPRPRFYALIWGQGVGALIILLGMLPYWLGAGGATVPSNISWRVGSICGILFLTMLIPLLKDSSVIEDLATDGSEGRERLAYDPVAVRNLLWGYLYLDLFLLTYLVHVTGGISGSMYGGLYLMLPTVSVLLKFDHQDALRAVWLATACCFGIFLSFFMSHYYFFEFNAADVDHAFDISLALVTFSSITLILFEIAVLRRRGISTLSQGE